MKSLHLAAALAAASTFGLMPAAATAMSAAAPLNPSAIVLAQAGHYDYGHHHTSHRSSRHHSHYVAGHRYRSAPHGWHRYHRRPGDWRTRGCILVGPIWFCP